MQEIPKVGGEAVLECLLESVWYLENVSLDIQLPDGVELVDGDLNWQGDLIAFQQVRIGPRIRVTSAGNKKIKAVAFCRVDEHTSYSDVAEFFFHSTPTAAVSGHVSDYVANETACVSETGEVCLPTRLSDYVPSAQPEPEPSPCEMGPGLEPPTDQEPVPNGTLTVTGTWYYYDRNDVKRPLKWVHAQLLRSSDMSVLAYTWIYDDGHYTFPPVTNPGDDGFRVRVRCYFSSSWACDGNPLEIKRAEGSDPYVATTSTRTAPDGTFDAGDYYIMNGSVQEPAWWLMQDLMEAFWWPFWIHDDHSTMAGGVSVIWSSLSYTGTYFTPGNNIYLKGSDADVCDTLLHEYGHSVHWDGYGGWLPSSDCPSPHYVKSNSGSHCAWFEGFATWFKCIVTDDPTLHWSGGGSVDYEYPSWNESGWDDGDLCEGRVTSAMWDMMDSNVDGIDTSELDIQCIWDTWYGAENRDNTFAEFWDRYKSGSGPTHDPVKALWQSTIDYNVCPSIAALPDIHTDENVPLDDAFDLTAYISDPESSLSELDFGIASTYPESNPAGVSIDSSGFVDVDPDPGWNGSQVVYVECSDDIDTSTGTFIVFVDAPNNPPEISGLPDQELDEDTSAEDAVDLWACSYDPETGNSLLTYQITGNTNPDCGASIDDLGCVDINPAENWNGSSTVTVRVTDPEGLWDEDSFVITVNPINDPPELGGIPDVSLDEDAELENAVDPWEHASDLEDSDSELEYSIVDNTNPECGVTIDGADYVDVRPDADWHGTSTVTIRATDTGGLWAEDSFVVTVNPVNDAPVVTGMPDALVEVDSSSNNAIDPYLYSFDVDCENKALTYTITQNTDPGCGVSLDGSDYIDINPDPGWTGASDITLRVEDTEGLWAEDTFRVVAAEFCDNIAQARALTDGTVVALHEKTATAKFSSYMYIEESSRVSGIRVVYGQGPEPGSSVTVAGPLDTAYAERLITPLFFEVVGQADVIGPLAMTNQSLGGISPDAYTAAVPPGGSGAYNVGLLVRTTGEVVRHAGGTFYIDDGSSVVDSWADGPAVLIDKQALGGWVPPLGSYVAVTGISGASTISGSPVRVLRPRSVDDVDVIESDQ